VVGALIPRGLTISADDVTIQGLSIYGFNQNPTDLVANTISADIWVGQAQFLPHPNDLITLPENYEQGIPQNTVIRDNWLGLKPDGTPGDYQSDFGVWLHQATGFVVEHNRIYDHGSNGIVTGAEATQGMIADNQIVRNGLTGLADGIRLEGNVAGTTIQRNLICENGGGGIYLYRTQGATTIADNQIQDNGDRVARAAIFLMGSDHLVQDNIIRDQNGAGVAIAAYPASHRNQIVGNVFAGLQGLSIDLIAQNNVGIQETQVADGVNPPRNSPNRRKETANGAINAPRFLSPQFYPINGVVYLDGIADPGAEIILYQVEEAGATHGTLNKIVTQTMADDKGNFSFSFNEFTPGTVYSAIAYLPDYGTSEPAANTTIQLLATPIESLPTESNLEENLSTSGASPLIETSVPKVDCRSTNATNPTTDAKIESTESME
jgi:parallel beta-helix repeat protein